MAGNGATERPWGSEEVLDLLRDRTTPATVLRRIAAESRLTVRREVKVLLVRHPSSPLALSRRFLPYLPWVELAELARDVRVGPVLRRDAERLLEARLPELAVGERISLARGASRRILAALRADPEAPVLRAVLENPRATVSDASALASAPGTPSEILEHLSRHPRFGESPFVRKGLLRNPSVPIPVALRLLDRTPRSELPSLLRDDRVPRIVRLAASRRLDRRS
jgi:hypothetical protein